MAIWPFGRKNKRHTIQVSADEANALQHALDEHESAAPVAEPTLGRKPSRRTSRKRWSRSGDGSDNQTPNGQTTSSQRPLSSIDHRRLSEIDHDHAGPDQPFPRPMSRTGSLLKKHYQNGPNKLRKSKRQTDEILREREIKLLSSTPIDIPRRSTQPMGSDYGVEHQRGKANGRRADRNMSDISLSIRDSADSSISDASDPFIYKVNAFAALTPRPVVRYVEMPRLPTARSTTTAASRPDSDRHPTRTTAGDDLYYSKRRVNELADYLDASTLRELLERDRRRREKKQIEDQEKLRRKLQERADAQAAEEHQQAIEATRQTQDVQAEHTPAADIPDTVEHQRAILEEPIAEEPEVAAPAEHTEQSGTWLQDESKDSEDAGRESMESVHVIGNIDDSSIREPTLATRPSFAPSHEMGMSRTTLSPSQSSLRHGLNSHSQSQIYGAGSTSDVSDRLTSDTSGRRGGNTITSLLRRGSSRIKRRYKERFQDPCPEVSNASHESFYHIQTQSSPPPPSIVPPRAFIATGIVKRSHSKFTEHFGDEPMSPPDSRIQSPDIPEQVPESSLENEEGSTFLHDPTPTFNGVDILKPKNRCHLSSADSFDESDNVPLSQSLASIDSEGSWMSGQFFRRMSQKAASSPVRTMTSFSAAIDSPVETRDDIRDSIDSRRASSNIMAEPELLETDDVLANDSTKTAETWHHSEVGRRPIVINPGSHPKSTVGMLKLRPSLSPIFAEEDYMNEDEDESKALTSHPQPQRVASVHGVICNAEDD